MNERSLLNLERTLIQRHFPGLQAREIAIVDAIDFDVRARDPRLFVSRAAAGSKPETIASLLTHALLHYEMKDSGHVHWYGHGPFFRRRANDLGVYSDTIGHRCFSMADWLDNPFLRSGQHAVDARAIDVIFALSRTYREELMDFFMNERWLKGGAKLPESLLPFVKFYSEELTDLLAVGMSVKSLTPKS